MKTDLTYFTTCTSSVYAFLFYCCSSSSTISSSTTLILPLFYFCYPLLYYSTTATPTATTTLKYKNWPNPDVRGQSCTMLYTVTENFCG